MMKSPPSRRGYKKPRTRLLRRRHHQFAAFEVLLYRLIQSRRFRQSDQLKNISNVLPEQRIENRVAVAREIVSEPPHPVAAFGNKKFFVCGVPLSLRHSSLLLHQGLARLNDPAPRLMIFRMTNPDAEIRVRPGARC